MPGDDTNSKAISAFYSYSHKDEKFREQLSSSLALLKRQQLIKEWYDGDIVPGEKWEKEIYEQLESSELILLLVSQDFINSDFIWGKELERAMARDSAGNARVVPIIIRPTDWQGSPLGVLQALPKNAKAVTLWSNRDAAWLDVARGIRKAIEDLRSGVTVRPGKTVTPVTPLTMEIRTATPVEQKQLDTQPRLELTARRAGAHLQRTIFTAENTNTLTGKVARQEGDPKTDDVTVNEAYDWLGVTYNFFWDIFGCNSIDGNGMPLHATVHYSKSYNNAFWNGSQIVFGDGDGILFNRFTIALDITAKEFANGFLKSQTRLEYWQQSGAIFDSSAIVFATMVKQYHLRQTVNEADWLIGVGLLGPQIKGKALFSLAEPGTAYDDPILGGKDRQPAHMNGYLRTSADNGGIHTNAGIPNHAFYLLAKTLGGYSWEKAGRIWYETLSDRRLEPKAQLRHFALLTSENASRLYGAKSDEVKAVKDAWNKVGLQIAKTRGRLA